MKKKRINTWVKTFLYMLGGAAFGAVLGILGFKFFGGENSVFKGSGASVLAIFQQISMPLMVLITVVTVVYGELNLRKLREIGGNILKTEDEECDRWEYELEKTNAAGVIVNTVSQIAGMLVLSTGYSFIYIESGNAKNLLLSCVVFVVCMFYNGVWQTRMVKQVQQIYPQMKGDPNSRDYQTQWLNSCDEAQKEQIYQSAYKAYLQTCKVFPLAIFVAMLGHLIFDTGLMAIILVAVLWLTLVLSYMRSAVKLAGAGLEK